MEYVSSKGIRCHRDVKPANIMINQGKTVRITDFGMAGALGPTQAVSGIKLNIQQGTVGLSGKTMEGTGFGTPTHMPPEQFTDAASCDERSDVYSFGVVLYQMASGGQYPFLARLPADDSEAEKARFWREMHHLHARAPMPGLNSPLSPIIQRCMQKEPSERYQSFKDARGNLDSLLRYLTGEVISPPESNVLAAWEWTNKGLSLDSLGHYKEAILCCDKALELDPRLAVAWSNRGSNLNSLGCYHEAIRCFDKALEVDPLDVKPWNNKGLSLNSLGRYVEAIRCYDKALELDPRCAAPWNNKGKSLACLGRNEEAVRCHDTALELDPQNTAAWVNKGGILDGLERYESAIRCYDKALELDPQYAVAWYNRALAQEELGRRQDAVGSYRQFLAQAPAQDEEGIAFAQQRVRELEGK
jgi:tetratricopeptide (TPR) repeat protein